MQEGTKSWEKRRSIKSRSRQNLSDISTDGSSYGSEAEGSEDESARRPRSRRDLYSANQPKLRRTRSMSQDTGLDRSDDFESIARGLVNLQSTVEANSTESFDTAFSDDEIPEKEKIFLIRLLKKYGGKIEDKIKKVSNMMFEFLHIMVGICVGHH